MKQRMAFRVACLDGIEIEREIPRSQLDHNSFISHRIAKGLTLRVWSPKIKDLIAMYHNGKCRTRHDRARQCVTPAHGISSTAFLQQWLDFFGTWLLKRQTLLEQPIKESRDSRAFSIMIFRSSFEIKLLGPTTVRTPKKNSAVIFIVS